MCSEVLIISCSTSGTRRFTLDANPETSHEWENNFYYEKRTMQLVICDPYIPQELSHDVDQECLVYSFLVNSNYKLFSYIMDRTS